MILGSVSGSFIPVDHYTLWWSYRFLCVFMIHNSLADISYYRSFTVNDVHRCCLFSLYLNHKSPWSIFADLYVIYLQIGIIGTLTRFSLLDLEYFSFFFSFLVTCGVLVFKDLRNHLVFIRFMLFCVRSRKFESLN